MVEGAYSVSVAQQPIASQSVGPFSVGNKDSNSWVVWIVVGVCVIVLGFVFYKLKK